MNTYENIRNWAEEKGIYSNSDLRSQFAKLMEEVGELAHSILKNNDEEFVDAIGDCVVVLTNLAAMKNHKIEDCVDSAYNVIKKRTGKMINGTFVKES